LLHRDLSSGLKILSFSGRWRIRKTPTAQGKVRPVAGFSPRRP